MTSKETIFPFKVQYKLLTNQITVVRDFLLPTLGAVMQNLYRNEDITTNRCEHMYVHQYFPDGTVKEVLNYERTPSSTALVPIKRAVKSTEIKHDRVITTTPNRTRVVSQGKYTFKEAAPCVVT